MEQNVSEKYQLVQDWLQKLYGDENVPKFEVNSDTVDSLYKLLLHYDKCNELIEIQLEDCKLHTIEYHRKNQVISNFLSRVGLPLSRHDVLSGNNRDSKPPENISVSSLDDPRSQKILDFTREFAYLSNILQIPSTDFSDISYAIQDLESTLQEYKTEVSSIVDQQSELEKMFLEMSNFQCTLKRVEQRWKEQCHVRKDIMTERHQGLKYLDGKAKEYHSSIQNLKDTIKQNGVNPQLFHQTLRDLYKQLCEMEKNTLEKIKQLKNFHNLPPDQILAKIKIEEAREHLRQLEKKLEQSANNLQFKTI